jgi:hypothetical protein
MAQALILIAQDLVLAAMIAGGPFRCGSKIIDVGITKAEVLQYCGPPTSEISEVFGTSMRYRWTYASTTYGATRLLLFVDDKLQSIRQW